MFELKPLAAVVLSLSILAPPNVLAAQQPGHAAPASVQGAGRISGTVLTAGTGHPLPAASVALLSAADSSLVTGALTDAHGGFRLEGIPNGSYELRITALGYRTHLVRGVRITTARQALSIGEVRLGTSPVTLKAVTATGHKEIMHLAPDRNTYVVRNMPVTRGGTAIDVLRNVPSVDVDIDNVISLRGNSGVVIEIDGRPTPMKGSQLGDFLAQLPADMVARVEVIPNPSAKYEPDGIAGIINIILKKKTDLGTSGGVSIGAGTLGSVSASGDVGYQRGRLSLYGSYAFERRNRPRSESIFRTNLYETPLSYLDETSTRSDKPISNTLTGSGSYQLAKHDQLSADLLYSTRHAPRGYTTVYRDLNASRVLTGMQDQAITGDHGESSLEATLGYKHTFEPERHDLAAELRLDRAGEGGHSDFTRDTLSLGGAPLGDPFRQNQVSWEHPLEASGKLDYTRTFGKALQLQAGYKGELLQYHTTLDTRIFDPAAAAWLTDSTQTNNFKYDEWVNAGYGLLQDKIGKVQLQAGVRLEHAATTFHLANTGATYHNNYNSVFPSALIAYNPDDADQLKISYSKRIRRPDDTDLLDPTPHYIDPLNVRRGNPYLQPEYIHSFELGYQRSGDVMTYQVTPFYRRTVNNVTRIQTIDSAGVATMTFQNLAHTDSYGTDMNASLHKGIVTGFVGASFFREATNGANLGPGLSARTFGWTARANATAHVRDGLDVQTLFFYRGPMRVAQGRIAGRTRLDVAIRQQLSKRFDVTMRVADPLNTSGEQFTTIDPRFQQVSDYRRRSRAVVLDLSYRFGKPGKKKPPVTDTTLGGN